MFHLESVEKRKSTIIKERIIEIKYFASWIFYLKEYSLFRPFDFSDFYIKCR